MNLSNSSTIPNLLPETSVDDIILVIVALVLSISIISVNFVTIVVIKRTHHLHTLSNIYIVSLAVVDLIVGLGLLPLSAFYVPSVRRDYYDRDANLCVFVLGTNLGMAVVSTLHMTLIATDRYLYIVWPYLYQKYVHRKLVFAILGSTWIFGIFYGLVPQFIYRDITRFNKCDITLIMPKEYLFYSNVSIYVLCVTVDVVLYSLILIAASRQRRVIRSSSQSVDSTNTDGSLSDTTTCITQYNISTICYNNRRTHDSNQFLPLSNSEISQQETTRYTESSHQSNNPQHSNNAQHSKTYSVKRPSGTSLPSGKLRHRNKRLTSVRFFMTVFGVYFFCLTPTVACMGIDYHQPIPRVVYNLFNLLALLNSGMNFLIFFVLNSRFRTSVIELCRCGKFPRHRNSSDIPFFDS
ncbi:unnamed protein product [Candidula unifasciata]|uniref:G-protein coupled receptors family 1 profile domain-containing protein n=1 Tax=Candidula unifasciata TaxID=100452 RepID=A0A8S3ZLC1_9EUPU|nr:unnamed protein product [Candidula unifasciata]